MDLKDVAVLVTAIGGAIAGIIGAIFGGYAIFYAAKAKVQADANKGELGAVKQVLGAVIEKSPDEMEAILKEADRLAAFAAGRRAAVEEKQSPPTPFH